MLNIAKLSEKRKWSALWHLKKDRQVIMSVGDLIYGDYTRQVVPGIVQEIFKMIFSNICPAIRIIFRYYKYTDTSWHGLMPTTKYETVYCINFAPKKAFKRAQKMSEKKYITKDMKIFGHVGLIEIDTTDWKYHPYLRWKYGNEIKIRVPR